MLAARIPTVSIERHTYWVLGIEGVVGRSAGVLGSRTLTLGASGTVISYCCHSNEAGTDSECQGVEEVRESNAHMDVIDNTGSKSIHCVVHEAEGYSNFVFVGSKCKCLIRDLAEAWA